MTAFTRNWNAAYETLPADADLLSEGAQRIRDLKLDARERLEVDHHLLGDTEDGEHKKVTFKTQTVDPTTAVDKGFIYTKDVSAKVELFWKDEDGTVIQLTTGGILNSAALALTTQGDVLYRDANGLARLAAGTSGQFLQTLGAGADPAWATVTAIAQATQAAIEAETNEDTYIPPDLLKHSPGVAKFWVRWDGTAAGPITPDADYNVVDVTDNGTGDYTINIDTDFSGINYSAGAMPASGDGRMTLNQDTTSAPAAGTFRVQVFNTGAPAAADATVFAWGFGDQ